MRPKQAWLVLLTVAALPMPTAAAEPLVVWPVDPHVKVFPDTLAPDRTGPIRLRAARNEYEPGQIALCSAAPLKNVSVRFERLGHADGKAAIEGDNLVWNFVGFIPLTKNTRDSEKLRVRTAPCDVPDPLLEARTLDLEAGRTQPVWLTVRVPADAPPGEYQGEVAVVAGDVRATVPFELTVDPFTLPNERHLLVTNWFNTGRIARAHHVEPWSEPFWQVLARYAENMAAHRQNVVYTPWTLIEVTREPDGTLSFKYDRFDRYVELFEKAGAADRIELCHVGHFGPGGWGGSQIVLDGVSAVYRASGKTVRLGPEEGLAPLLSDLQEHLRRRGWLEKAMIHVADEPSINNVRSWREASGFVRRAAPEILRIDAIEGIDFSGALEVWVPKLSHFDRWREAYEARRGDGQIWYYICCHPYGNVYPNRFLDYPTTCVRVLHWINFAEDLSGYLHWGLNAWGDDPFGTPPDRLPPGDTHTIYPGSEGPLNSIRWEIQRESIEDYEYLHLLAAKTADLKRRLGDAAAWLDPERRASELARRVVPSIAETQRDPAQIMAARAAVADEIVALDRPPLLLIQTEPREGSTLINGPIAVQLRGVTAPGAEVKVNGRQVEVRDDGTFACNTGPSGGEHTIVVQSRLGDDAKTAVRRFLIRN